MAKELYRKAQELLASKQLEECHKLLTKLIQDQTSTNVLIELNKSELADIYNTRGHIKYLWVDFDEAIQDYTQAIQYDSSLAVAYYNRGQVHYRMGRYTQAETDLLQAIKLKPDFTDAILNLNQVQKDIASGHRFNI